MRNEIHRDSSTRFLHTLYDMISIMVTMMALDLQIVLYVNIQILLLEVFRRKKVKWVFGPVPDLVKISAGVNNVIPGSNSVETIGPLPYTDTDVCRAH
jgi:hypothetical protein